MNFHFLALACLLCTPLLSNAQSSTIQDDVESNDTILITPVFDQLVWSDEFDEEGAIDTTNWFHQTQLPAGGSWYNNEVQHYTDRLENAYVEDGLLKIVAQKETYTDQGYTKNYTSARLNSKVAFRYGKFEMRAKLPFGTGTWPAFWMLGQNTTEAGAYWETQGFGTTPWPACGEIDIMEHWGHNQNYVQSALHTPSSHGATVNHGGQTIATASTDFHVYALEWTAEKMTFSVDNVVHYVYDPAVKNAETWPFDAEQYVLLNVAIQPGIDPGFSSGAMEVDYIRVYQESTPSPVSSIADQDVIIYPNLVINELTIDLKQASDQIVTLKLYDMDGKLINAQSTSVTNNQIKLDKLEGLPEGIYLIEFDLDQTPYRLKFIKS